MFVSKLRKYLRTTRLPSSENKSTTAMRRRVATLEQLEARYQMAVTIINSQFATVPGNVQLLGTAYHDAGAQDVVLTQAAQGQQGSLIVSSHGMAARVHSGSVGMFLDTDSSGGDGMSIGYGNLSGNSFGEGGEWGTGGYWFVFDTFAHINAPVDPTYNAQIRIYHNDSLLRTHDFNGVSGNRTREVAGRGYYTFTWSVNDSGLLQYNHPATGNQSIQLTGWNPQRNWRFGAGARTGAAIDKQVVSHLSITDNSNHIPYGISLSNNAINENLSASTVVGTFSTSDPDVDGGSGDSFSYSLVAGFGSNGNSQFHISGNQLRTSTSFNYESTSSYPIRVRTTDSNGNWYERTFTIFVNDVNEAPTALTVVNPVTSLNENTSTASTIALGQISVADDSLGTNVLSISGPDASAFEIVGTQLRLKAGTNLDYETKSSYSITINVDDATIGGTPDKSIPFSLAVNDLAEVWNVRVGDGTAQRSQVNQVVVTFDGQVDIDPGAFTVRRRGSGEGAVVTTAGAPVLESGRTVVTLTFSGALTRGVGALLDGNYELEINAAAVRRAGTSSSLDGDRNGTAGGQFLFGNQASDAFFALFGDIDGNRNVSVSDNSAFRLAYGSQTGQAAYNALFDYDEDGDVDFSDYYQFRGRYGRTMNFQ